ncbi:serine hydrolase domain-containing protein [Puia dinghuensis]|uniref:Beta-lactamase-related domain-containing protein n=1 Tax=Puia dinghuensis TaxID=1792502 RepID=A0A8J2UHQ6_9BACT|nr:serine hydrolase domain-containing protein [Puia dinghuensis]GGB17761.1 hypothetical protein GCM10011511_46960 [Puia dinghuensis]
MKYIFFIVAMGLLGICRGQEPFAKVDAWLQENARDMGGRAILVVAKDGQIVHTKSVNDMSSGQRMVDRWIARQQHQEASFDDYSVATRQPIASCSKWLSAALIMTFVDEGKLPMEGEPGKVFHYSNAGLQIAGAILEKVSGESFETLFGERIARPLEMTHTDFGKGPVALPAGGASSTPEDYIHFLEMIVNRGVYHDVRVLSEQSVSEMQVNRLGPEVRIAYTPAENGGAGVGYGYGEWIMGEAVSSPGLFGSFPWIVNARGYCAFLMTVNLNNKGRQDREMELVQLVDAAL